MQNLIRRWWREARRDRGLFRATADLARRVASALLDLIPARRRRRFGDAWWDYDHDVNTTWSNVPLRTRFREALLGAEYQATDPTVFAELMQALSDAAPSFDPAQFTFVDLGSGKGRALLLAAEFPFRRLTGVELLPELHAIAERNLGDDSRATLVCGDACEFAFPPEPCLVYFFNPFPEHIFRRVLANLEHSWRATPRPVYIAFHNLLYPQAVKGAAWLETCASTVAFNIYRARGA